MVSHLKSIGMDKTLGQFMIGKTMKKIMRNLKTEDIDEIDIDFYWGEVRIETSREGDVGFYYKTYRLNLEENRLEIAVSILDDLKRRPLYAIEKSLTDEEVEKLLSYIRRHINRNLKRLIPLR